MDFSIFSNFDHAVFAWIQENIWCRFLDVVMPIITVLGEGGWFWIALTVILLCSKKYRKAGVTMGFALLVMLLINDLTLKNIFVRPRPFNFEPFADLYTNFAVSAEGKPELLVGLPSSFSFPSGHTSSSFAAATGILLNKQWKLGIPMLILAMLIGFSRNYLMVHYPTDVLFGALFGIVYALISYFFIAKYVYPAIEKKIESRKAKKAAK